MYIQSRHPTPDPCYCVYTCADLLPSYKAWLADAQQEPLRERHNKLRYCRGAESHRKNSLVKDVHVPKHILDEICISVGYCYKSEAHDYIRKEYHYTEQYRPHSQREGVAGEVWVIWRLLCDGRLDELKEEAQVYRTKLEEGIMTAQQFEVRHVEGLQASTQVHGT